MDGLTSLSHVCDREKIQYSAVHAAESEYGVDTFSIRVEAQNQAAVDALIANFRVEHVRCNFHTILQEDLT